MIDSTDFCLYVYTLLTNQPKMTDYVLLNQWTIFDVCRTYESLDSIEDVSKLKRVQQSFSFACSKVKFTSHTQVFVGNDGVPVFFDLYSTFEDKQSPDESAFVMAKIQARITRCTPPFSSSKTPYTDKLLMCMLEPVHTIEQQQLMLPKTYELVWLYRANPNRLFSIVKKVTSCVTGFNNSKQLSELCNSEMDDLNIYRRLKHDDKQHQLKVSNQVGEMLQMISKVNAKPETILDFGGGSGDFVHELQQCLESLHSGLKVRAVCIEVSQWYSKTHEAKFASIEYKYTSTYSLDLQDEYFDCVSAMHVLHHCDKVQDTLKELYRVIKVGGVLFLREHDAQCKKDHVAIDIEHLLYEVVCRKNESALRSYFGTYFARRYLYSLLSGVGFKFVTDTPAYGVTNSYYTLWVK